MRYDDKDGQSLENAYSKVLNIVKESVKKEENVIKEGIEDSSKEYTDEELHKQCIVAFEDILKDMYPGDVKNKLPKIDWLIGELKKKVRKSDTDETQKVADTPKSDYPIDTTPKTEGINYSSKSLSELARIIAKDWSKVYFGAVPYLRAMASLNSINDNYGMDDGRSIVAYFLSNASQWKGPVAKAVKMELNKRLKAR